jgi:DNA (cytosine-5)-methyltransferase 1
VIQFAKSDSNRGSGANYSIYVVKQKQSSSFTVVDLFAGVGGLSYGFSNGPEFEVLAANEVLPAMAQAYRLNHPDVAMFEGDIKDLTGRAIRNRTKYDSTRLDLLVGGPPCQAYSTVGKRLLEDPRAQLFREYFRLLKELKPRMFIYENVRGLLSMEGGELFDNIVRLFATLDYKIQAVVVNAADYGVPQTRERVILIGTSEGLMFEYPEPSHCSPDAPRSASGRQLPPWRTLRDAIGDLPLIGAGEESFEYATEPQNDFQRRMRKHAPRKLADHNAPSHGSRLTRIMDALPEGGGIMDLPARLRPTSGFPNTYARLWWDRPSTTITRNLGTPSSSRCIHPMVSRGLTTREGARLQSFPDRYKFYGSRTERNLQIGNAVPVLLSEALAKQVRKALDR